MLRLVSLSAFAAAACAPVPPADAPAPAERATAWVSFGGDGVIGQGADGLADRSTARALTVDDPVRVASVSKLVVALGVMRLVEQGVLDLDADVSEQLGWRLRNPAFPDTPITLRLLLSHRSSLSDDGEAYIIPIGETLRGRIAQGRAFDAQHAPGGYFRYANLNFPVIATVMERATGERFDRLMDRQVIAPLGLQACFNWAMCDDRTIARAVVLYNPDGSTRLDALEGRRPDCPVYSTPGAPCDLTQYVPGTNGGLFSPQGGLRISARGLSVIGRMIVNGGKHDGAAFLRPDSIDAMFRSEWRFDGANGETDDGFYCTYGLGTRTVGNSMPGCADGLFGARMMAGHAGEAYGVRSGLWIDRTTGTGIAFFATNNGADPPKGRSAYRLIEEQLARNLDR